MRFLFHLTSSLSGLNRTDGSDRVPHTLVGVVFWFALPRNLSFSFSLTLLENTDIVDGKKVIQCYPHQHLHGPLLKIVSPLMS